MPVITKVESEATPTPGPIDRLGQAHRLRSIRFLGQWPVCEKHFLAPLAECFAVCVRAQLALLSVDSPMRALSTRLLLLIVVLSFVAPPHVAAATQDDYMAGPLPVFELHSGFWINLHHTLYQEARQRGAARNTRRENSSNRQAASSAPTAGSPLDAAEQKTWDAAVAFYASTYADKDLLFSTELVLITNQLGDFEDCDELSGRKKRICDAGLPASLTQALESAAPVYRTHQWPSHDRANRRWIAGVAPLVREQSVGLSERLADIYQTRWPKEKIRVDVSAYANTAGAYTTIDPLRVRISSLDTRNQGAEALEVLFHEASHGIAQPVQDAIIRECRQRDKAIPRDLWHALIFYTTGEVIRPIMVSQHSQMIAPHQQPSDANVDGHSPRSGAAAPGAHADSLPNSPNAYTPYAIRERLYERGWDGYLQLLTRFWQPYLEGKSTFDDAIARMVSSL